MKLDVEKYMPYVEEFDLTDDQKRELIQTIWNMMEGFIDLAFEQDPTQTALRAASAKTASELEVGGEHEA